MKIKNKKTSLSPKTCLPEIDRKSKKVKTYKKKLLLNRKIARSLFRKQGKQIGDTAMNAFEELVKKKIISICGTMGGAIKRISLSDILALQNINKKKTKLVKRGVL